MDIQKWVRSQKTSQLLMTCDSGVVMEAAQAILGPAVGEAQVEELLQAICEEIDRRIPVPPTT